MDRNTKSRSPNGKREMGKSICLPDFPKAKRKHYILRGKHWPEKNIKRRLKSSAQRTSGQASPEGGLERGGGGGVQYRSGASPVPRRIIRKQKKGLSRVRYLRGRTSGRRERPGEGQTGSKSPGGEVIATRVVMESGIALRGES